jgi:dipeptidase E
VVFVPYAAVTIGWDVYAELVRRAFGAFGVGVQSVHDAGDAAAAIANAEAMVVGGGNTFHLLAHLQRRRLSEIIRQRVLAGVPYMGWSAGSVVACPTMQTTNDMPIVEPETFAALRLVGFQINAHFTDVHPPGFQGETRRQRLAEFVTANPDVSVLGLPEGTWLQVAGPSVVLHGSCDAPVFRAGREDAWVTRGSELGPVLEPPSS